MNYNSNSLNNLAPFTPGQDERRKGNGRKPVKFLTNLLLKELKGPAEIIVEGVDVETGKPVKCRVSTVNKKEIVLALLKEAKRGNVLAIREVLDRVEGKTPQAVNLTDNEGNAVPIQLIFQAAPGNDPLLEND
jgi:hypothetical protein